MINLFVLKVLTFLSIFSCFCLLTTTNPIYSAFLLIFIFVLVSLFLLILNIKFLTFVIIILYAGAVSILFLFIIFTLNLKIQITKIKSHVLSSIIIIISLVKLTSSVFSSFFSTFDINTFVYNELQNNFAQNRFNFEWNEIEIVGNLLYSHYWFLFVLIGFILLLVMVGVVLLSKTLNFTK